MRKDNDESSVFVPFTLANPLAILYNKPGSREAGKPGSREAGKPGSREAGKPGRSYSLFIVVWAIKCFTMLFINT
jgi:hypothetical protein